jgi:hypothetical protein
MLCPRLQLPAGTGLAHHADKVRCPSTGRRILHRPAGDKRAIALSLNRRSRPGEIPQPLVSYSCEYWLIWWLVAQSSTVTADLSM